jgi:hypothetical protein
MISFDFFISIALSGPKGLMVPVIRVENLSFRGVEQVKHDWLYIEMEKSQ